MNKNQIIYNKIKLLEQKRKDLLVNINTITTSINSAKASCNHELVFMLNDGKSYKVGKINTCNCPICGKLVLCYYKNELENSDFKNSKIIDLTELKVPGILDAFARIKNEVIKNIDFYYNMNNSDEIIKESIKKVLTLNGKSLKIK